MAKKSDEALPSLGKWKYLYMAVIGWLLVQIVLYYLLTIAYK